MKRTDDRRVRVHSAYRNRLEDESECSRSANLKTLNELPVNDRLTLPWQVRQRNSSDLVLRWLVENRVRRITPQGLTCESVGTPVEAWAQVIN